MGNDLQRMNRGWDTPPETIEISDSDDERGTQVTIDLTSYPATRVTETISVPPENTHNNEVKQDSERTSSATEQSSGVQAVAPTKIEEVQAVAPTKIRVVPDPSTQLDQGYPEVKIDPAQKPKKRKKVKNIELSDAEREACLQRLKNGHKELSSKEDDENGVYCERLEQIEQKIIEFENAKRRIKFRATNLKEFDKKITSKICKQGNESITKDYLSEKLIEFNEKYKYKLSKPEIKELVWKSQKEVIRVNRKIRENQLNRMFDSYCDCDQRSDPAVSDPELRKKLKENAKLGKQKMFRTLDRMHQKLREPQNDCEGVSAETDETIKPQNTSDV